MCGPEPFGVLNQKKTQGFVIDINNGAFVSTFNGGGDGFQGHYSIEEKTCLELFIRV